MIENIAKWIVQWHLIYSNLLRNGFIHNSAWILKHVAIYIIFYSYIYSYNLVLISVFDVCVIDNCKLVANYLCIISYSCFTAAFI